jgi:glycosyltransferase involved in cell wall biosynthesis
MTAVEALASGKPVIALAKGGALETVPTSEPLGGLLYDDATDQSLKDAIERWDAYEAEVVPRALQTYAARFSEAEFSKAIGALVFGSDFRITPVAPLRTGGNL